MSKINKVVKFFLILLVPLFLFFAKVSLVSACSCARSFPGPLGILKAFGDNDAVFTGKVVDTKLEREKDNYEIVVDILKSYKYSGGLTQIKIFTNDPNGTTCGYPARRGREYLFYASETQKGDFTINNCSRTGELADRMDDISFLDKWKFFNDSAFKVYQLIGVPTLIPIRHKTPPELEYRGEVPGTFALIVDIYRNAKWFEGWKVYVNLFIWVSVLVIVVFFLGKFIISRIRKTKLKK